MTWVDVVDAVETIFINYKNYCIYVMPEVNQGWYKLFSYSPLTLPYHRNSLHQDPCAVVPWFVTN